jgi:hypothetical protein
VEFKNKLQITTLEPLTQYHDLFISHENFKMHEVPVADTDDTGMGVGYAFWMLTIEHISSVYVQQREEHAHITIKLLLIIHYIHTSLSFKRRKRNM